MSETKCSKSGASYLHKEGTQYQCYDCPFWIEGSAEDPTMPAQACTLHQPKDAILRIDSCNYYVKGPHDTMGFVPLGFLTKQESGWARNEAGFSCKRCAHWDEVNWDCEGVDKDSPGDDPGMIHPDACCNEWKPDPVRSQMRTDMFYRES